MDVSRNLVTVYDGEFLISGGIFPQMQIRMADSTEECLKWYTPKSCAGATGEALLREISLPFEVHYAIAQVYSIGNAIAPTTTNAMKCFPYGHTGITVPPHLYNYSFGWWFWNGRISLHYRIFLRSLHFCSLHVGDVLLVCTVKYTIRRVAITTIFID